MRRIVSILVLFFITAKVFGQNPLQRPIGLRNEIAYAQGGLGSDSILFIPEDTTARKNRWGINKPFIAWKDGDARLYVYSKSRGKYIGVTASSAGSGGSSSGTPSDVKKYIDSILAITQNFTIRNIGTGYKLIFGHNDTLDVKTLTPGSNITLDTTESGIIRINATVTSGGTGGSGDVSNVTVAALRTLTAPSSTASYYTTDAGNEAFWRLDPSDNTTADDGIDCIVTFDGKRLKKVRSNSVYSVLEFGAKGDGTTIDNAAIINALNFVAAKGGGTLYFPKRIYKLDATASPSTYGEFIIFIPSNVTVCCPDVTFTATNSFAFEMKSNSNWYGNLNTVLYRGRLILRAGTENIIVDGIHPKFSQYHAIHFSGYKSNNSDTLAMVGRNIIVRNAIIDSSSRHGVAFHRALGAYTNGVDSLYNGIWENVTVENAIVNDPSYVSPGIYYSHFDYAFGLEDCKGVKDIKFIYCYAYRAPGAGWHKENHVWVSGRVKLDYCGVYYNGADTTISGKSNYGYGIMYDDGYTLNGCHGFGNRKGEWGLEGGVHGNNWAFNNCYTDGMEAFTWQPGITDNEYHLNPKNFGGNSGGWIYANGSLSLPQKSVQSDYFSYGLDSTTVTDLDGTTQKKYTPYLKNSTTSFSSANRENSIALPLIKVDTAAKYKITVTMKTISGSVGSPSLYIQEYDKNYSLINRNSIHYLLKADLTSVNSNWTTYTFYIGSGAVLEENPTGTFGGNSAEFMRSATWLRLAVSFSESSSYNKIYALSQFNIDKALTASVSTDAAVTGGSTKPVQSGAVKVYADAGDAALQNQVGTLSNLVTTDKSNIVNAINEVKNGAGGATISGMPTVANLSALKAINNASNNSVYYLAGINAAGDGGGGPFLWNATSTATPDDALVVQATGVTTGRYLRQIENNNVYLKWFGTKSDWNSTLTSLIGAGYKIHGEFGATYNVNGSINITNKNILFDGHGAKITFTTSGSNYLINQTITNTTPLNVTKISYGNTAAGGIDTIVTSGLLGVQKGELVKIYSDDKVATFNTGADVRKAEFIIPIYVNSGGGKDTLIIQRYLNYEYKTNVKVAKIPYYTTDIRNVQLYATSGTAGGFNIVGVTKPIIDNVTFQHLLYPAITVRGCYEPKILNSTFNEVEDAIGGPGPSGSTGYGVNDNNCQGLVVDGCTFTGLRHAYTTNGQATAGDYNTYGEALHEKVINSFAKNVEQGFDTHEQGYDIFFGNLQVSGAVAGLQLRARNITVSNCVADSVGTGIICGANSMDSTSRVVLNNVTLKRTAGSVIIANSAGIQNLHINGGYFEGKDIVLSRTNVIASGLTSILTGQTGSGIDQWITADSESIVEANGCNITSTAPQNFALTMVQNGAKIFVNSPILKVQNAGSIHLARAQSTSTTNSIVHVKNALFVNGNTPTLSTSTLTASLPNGFPAYTSQIGKLSDLKLSWKCERTDNTTTTSASANMPLIISSGSVTWYNNYYDDDFIVGTFYNVTANTDLSGTTIPVGKVGQRIILYNPSNFTITLPLFNSGSAVTLPAKGTKSITSTGTAWVY